jgi:hypothetical protein
MSVALLKRLFPCEEVRAALASVTELERNLPDGFCSPEWGFAAIKSELRRQIIEDAGDIRKALQTTPYSIPVLCLLHARNVVWDELETGRYMSYRARTTMAGDGLISLHRHLTNLLQQAGVLTADEAKKSTASKRDDTDARLRGLRSEIRNFKNFCPRG